MKTNHQKILLVIFFIIASSIGFLIKLPRAFHHYDKELHAAFYFLGFIFLSVLFPKRWYLIMIVMVIFGWFIEYAQEFINKITIRLIGRAIHGRFDIEDIKYNLIGLFAAVVLFLIFRAFSYIFRQK